MKALNDIRVQFGIYMAIAIVLGGILTVTSGGDLSMEAGRAHFLFGPLVGWIIAGFLWFTYSMLRKKKK